MSVMVNKRKRGGGKNVGVLTGGAAQPHGTRGVARGSWQKIKFKNGRKDHRKKNGTVGQKGKKKQTPKNKKGFAKNVPGSGGVHEKTLHLGGGVGNGQKNDRWNTRGKQGKTGDSYFARKAHHCPKGGKTYSPLKNSKKTHPCGGVAPGGEKGKVGVRKRGTSEKWEGQTLACKGPNRGKRGEEKAENRRQEKVTNKVSEKDPIGKATSLKQKKKREGKRVGGRGKMTRP